MRQEEEKGHSTQGSSARHTADKKIETKGKYRTEKQEIKKRK
jgi:hypothetical protein